MADNIRLINILPAQPVQSAQAVQLPQQGSSGPVLPPSLTPGTTVSGFIINRDSGGNPVLRTTTGDITFASQFFLKIGSEVVIRIAGTQGNTQAHIVTVDGQPPELAAQLSAFDTEPDVIISKQPQQLATQTYAAPQTNVATPANTAAANALPQPSQPLPAHFSGIVVSPSVQPAIAALLPAGTRINFKVVETAPESLPADAEIPLAGAPRSAAPQTAYTGYGKGGTQHTPLPLVQAAISGISAPTQEEPQPQSSSVVLSQPEASKPVAEASKPVAPAGISIPATPVITAEAPRTLPAALPPVNTATPAQDTPALPTPAQPASVTVQAPPQMPPALAVLPRESTQIQETPSTTGGAVPKPAQETLRTGSTIQAQVVGTEPSGEPVIETPAGLVKLEAYARLATGSTLSLEVTQTALPHTGADVLPSLISTVASQPAPLVQLAQQWTALQHIFSLLGGRPTGTGLDIGLAIAQTADPQSGAAFAPGVTPQTVSSGVFAFIAALKGGDFRSWLGETNARLLEDRGHANLIRKAQGEFALIADQFNAPPTQQHQWQPLFFPVAVEGQLEQIRLFTKREKHKQGSGERTKESEDTRFVIEMDLSRLGEMQMDGFVRRHAKDLQFDMVIRTTSVLRPEIQEDILRIYSDTGAITGYKGSISFQAVREFPINPMQEIAASHNSVIA